MSPIQWANGGKILWGPGGKIAFDPDCCCVSFTPGDDCAHCDAGGSPAQFTVVFSGLSDNCVPDQDGLTASYRTDLAGLTLTVTLNQGYQINVAENGIELADPANACVWAGTMTGTIAGKSYTTADCTGTPTSENITMYVQLTRSAGQWVLQVRGVDTTYPATWWVFNSTKSETSCTSFSMTGNALTNGRPTLGGIVKTITGGTATVSAV